MSEKTVRKIFIFILFFLPLQYIVVGVVGYYMAEPWPAFVFPGFKNVYESNNYYLVQQTRFELYGTGNEKIASVEPYHFFPDVPHSQIAGLMRSVFHDLETIRDFSPEAKELLYHNSRRIAGRDVRRMEIVQIVDFLKSGSGNLKADSTASQLIGMIHFTN